MVLLMVHDPISSALMITATQRTAKSIPRWRTDPILEYHASTGDLCHCVFDYQGITSALLMKMVIFLTPPFYHSLMASPE
jgi:hypothetical protein